jgi:MoaA/NifB/PqqE/SkfB family radical SAM enzyme
VTDDRPHIQSLIFETTQQCNHACLHCYNIWNPAATSKQANYPKGQLDTATTLELLNKSLDETRCSHVTLTGGETLLRKDLPQILDLLQERNVTSTIISNGRLLDEPTVVDLLDRGVGLFELPLLSHRREKHDYLSGCPGAFDAVLAAMAHIRYHHGQFVAVFVATKHNLPDLYDMIKIAFAFGSRGIMFNRFNPGGRGRDHLEDLLPTADQIHQVLTVVFRPHPTLPY